MKKMLVVGSESYGVPMRFAYDYMCNGMYNHINTPHHLKEKPDLVVFTGGEDINPAMYGEPSLEDRAYYNDTRDTIEKKWYFYAKANKIPMVGICRGMQLFTAMQGGTLLQHIDGHATGKGHKITTKDHKNLMVNSLHHQVCVPYLPNGKAISHVMLAWSNEGDNWKGTERTNTLFNEMGCVPEAIWYPEINALGVQFHPEMMQRDSEGYSYFKNILQEYINET